MPMVVNFRWKSPTLRVPESDAEKNNLNENLMQLGQSIADIKAARYNREQQERRNAIEDENRAMEAAERERRQKAYGEAAGLIRGRSSERERLLQERAAVVAQINELKQRLGL